MEARKGKTKAAEVTDVIVGRNKTVRESVGDTKELQRIIDLPRRDWTEHAEELAATMTARLKKPNGSQALFPVQAVSLYEIYKHERGALLPIQVGGGKTLISYLAAWAAKSRVTVLLVPASLRQKTLRDFRSYGKHWKRPPGRLIVLNYEKLSSAKSADILDRIKPDLIVADECQKLKNRKAACTKRVHAYLRKNPETRFVGLSGTIVKRSIMDFHHHAGWALGDGMPLPMGAQEATTWARAVDPKPDGPRVQPGALSRLGPVEDREQARKTLGERIGQTPGVVVTAGESTGSTLILSTWAPDLDPEIAEALERLRKDHVTPWGDEVADPRDLWRVARQLVCGFSYRWEPPPPPEWLLARKRWKGFARYVLDQGVEGLDSELRVANAVKVGKLNDKGRWDAWAAIRSRYHPEKNRATRWISKDTLRQAVKVIGKKPSLVWVEHRAVGHALAQATGWPYAYKDGADEQGRLVESYAGKQTVILSIASNHKGLNLQAWNHNDILMPPSSGDIWEQIMGRTDRTGQEADEITYRVMLGDPSVEAGFANAFADARFQWQTLGQPQKLLLADKE